MPRRLSLPGMIPGHLHGVPERSLQSHPGGRVKRQHHEAVRRPSRGRFPGATTRI